MMWFQIYVSVLPPVLANILQIFVILNSHSPVHCPGTKLNADSGLNVFLVSLFLKIHKQNYHVLKLFNLAFHSLIQHIKYRHCPWLLTLQLQTNKNSTYVFTKLNL